jgi:radical SAM protein with 4Fe4S-binding SPASM domain
MITARLRRRASKYITQVSSFGPMGLVNLAGLKAARMTEPRKVHAYPSFIQVEVTTICNYRCEMCWLGLLHLDEVKERYEGRFKHMTIDEFRTIFRDIKYTECVLLQGIGEPFLNPDFFDMIHDLHDRNCPHTWVITNGSRMTPEVSRDLLDSRVGELCISLDAATPATFERVRRGGNFREVVDNLSGLVEEKRRRGVDYPEIALIFVALKSNIQELPDLIRLARELGVDRVDVKEFSQPHPSLDHLVLDNSDREYLLEARRLSRDLGVRTVFFHKLLPEDMPTTRQKCYWPWNSMVVTIDGYVTTCWYNYHPQESNMGNIFEEGFHAIWNGEKYRAFREGLARGNPCKPTICQNCPGYS